MPPNHTPPQLFLIDGYALIYRAFFAMISRPLRTAKGENTSAAWGVVNFLLRLREKYRPDYVAWINDAGTSFREERYAEYKSTREKLDNELQADFDRSVQRIGQLLEAFGIPLITVPGYEADDVIGTLATAGAERGLQVVIVSGDKDFYQLVGSARGLAEPRARRAGGGGRELGGRGQCLGAAGCGAQAGGRLSGAGGRLVGQHSRRERDRRERRAEAAGGVWRPRDPSGPRGRGDCQAGSGGSAHPGG